MNRALTSLHKEVHSQSHITHYLLVLKIFKGIKKKLYDCCNFIEPGHGASHASDGDRYTIMTYGNGAGFKANQAEVDEDYELYIQRGPVPEESLDYEYKFPSSAPLSSETHGGDDVGIWAIGIYGVFVFLHFKTRNQKKYNFHLILRF